MSTDKGGRDSEPIPKQRFGDRARAALSLRHAKRHPERCLFAWRRERDSNPRVLAHKLISSQPRYDHFDISPYMIKLKTSLIFVVILRGAPLCPIAVPEIFCSRCSQNFDRCHSFLLASSATGSARKRPHFDISPY